MKKIIFLAMFLSLIIYHFYQIKKIEQKTALDILDSLRIMELEVTPDEEKNDDKIYLSPRKYARRIAIMDCEQLVYEKYRLWR